MIICIVGPTAVGKTRLSEELSIKYDASIINCDAMQVYKEMDIGTAKYTKDEDMGQKHYLFDIKEVPDIYTVFDYQKDLRYILEQEKGKNVIIVGGTGLYLKAGLYNYEFTERDTTNTYDEYTNEELYEMLKNKGVDDVHPNNRRRLISRLNSSGNTGKKDELLYHDVVFIGLTTDRKKLYEKIDKRVDEMMASGLLDETKYLYQKYGMTKSMKTGIGYKELITYLRGLATYEEAIRILKQRTRQYAKRQYTWFKHQMNIEWFQVDYDDFSNTIKDVENYITKTSKHETK